MQKTKIEWCDYTWNPVWGCKNECSYCYARRLAKRWGESFEPHWKEKNFNRAFPKKPSKIFVNSMSEIAFWNVEWFVKVFHKIDLNPQHIFLFLTKDQRIYNEWYFPNNCWLGVTATTQDEVRALVHRSFIICDENEERTNKYFVSIEPILSFINPNLLRDHGLDWLIIGAETGNRKEKVIPDRDWIDPLLTLDMPIFLKDSLKPLYGDNLEDWRQFPNSE